MAFSDNIVRLKNEKGVTNYRIAKEIGVSCTTVQNWIDGKTAPQLELAFRVAAYFGKTIDEMMK